MEENNTSSKELPKYDKKDIEQCILKFQNHILNNINDIEKIKNTLLNLSKERKTESELMSSFSLKIYLNTLSTKKDATLKTWLEETLSQRNSYKEKLKNLLQINQFKGDPLGGGENGEGGGWNNFFDKTEIKNLINLDVERTFQERDLFCESSIKEIEYNVLFLFAENNQPINYKQGMSDILAMLIFTLYPYYTKSENKEYNNELFEKWVNEPSNYIKDIYNFFHDENEFQSDLYYLMNNLMKLGVNKFYEDNKDKNENYLIKRCDNIFEKIKKQNYQLYYHFINNKLDLGVILQRWIKCLFTREFHPKDIILILDTILYNEVNNPSGELIYIDYFCIAMVDFISEELLKKDQNECFKRLFTYPPLESIDTLITLADKIKSNKNDNIPNNINENNLESKKSSTKKVGSGSMADFLFSSKKTNNNTSSNNTIKINNTNNSSTSMASFFNNNTNNNSTNISNLPNNTNNNKKAKAPNLMFVGNYTNNKKTEPANSANTITQKNSQQTNPKKIPMFGNINNNSQDNKNKNQIKPTFIPNLGNTRSYTVSNEENVKNLNELKALVDFYIKEFSYEDKMKIGFLIDKLSKEL